MTPIGLTLSNIDDLLRGKIVQRTGGPSVRIFLGEDVTFDELKRIILLAERDALADSPSQNAKS